jgi:hypothetical protein
MHRGLARSGVAGDYHCRPGVSTADPRAQVAQRGMPAGEQPQVLGGGVQPLRPRQHVGIQLGLAGGPLLLVELGAQVKPAQLLAVPRVGQELRDAVAGEEQPGVLPARRVLADHLDHAVQRQELRLVAAAGAVARRGDERLRERPRQGLLGGPGRGQDRHAGLVRQAAQPIQALDRALEQLPASGAGVAGVEDDQEALHDCPAEQPVRQLGGPHAAAREVAGRLRERQDEVSSVEFRVPGVVEDEEILIRARGVGEELPKPGLQLAGPKIRPEAGHRPVAQHLGEQPGHAVDLRGEPGPVLEASALRVAGGTGADEEPGWAVSHRPAPRRETAQHASSLRHDMYADSMRCRHTGHSSLTAPRDRNNQANLPTARRSSGEICRISLAPTRRRPVAEMLAVGL